MQNSNNDYVYVDRDSKSECDYGAFYVFETTIGLCMTTSHSLFSQNGSIWDILH